MCFWLSRGCSRRCSRSVRLAGAGRVPEDARGVESLEGCELGGVGVRVPPRVRCGPSGGSSTLCAMCDSDRGVEGPVGRWTRRWDAGRPGPVAVVWASSPARRRCGEMRRRGTVVDDRRAAESSVPPLGASMASLRDQHDSSGWLWVSVEPAGPTWRRARSPRAGSRSTETIVDGWRRPTARRRTGAIPNGGEGPGRRLGPPAPGDHQTLPRPQPRLGDDQFARRVRASDGSAGTAAPTGFRQRGSTTTTAIGSIGSSERCLQRDS